ncbi:helix-turn-helix domain-containing protein [Brevibacterium casei]|uniref:HTH-type transcriptional regulator sinR n=2 Tax=Brevibacterium casei TaxID=33889 RepID=A0A449DCE5_9MICO|nr:helix-turn-helix transcriptional regulator [Brevibacterium casei]QPR39462.1 helix-turn-helix transcriptional regulator [Brevibacterium casei]QPR43627.1 helix-turn-helix transcriptional regulator [Brevibacterium casei]QPS35123.1 helix-turn-helix transcriptional regulator [Brevibacterium casei]SMX80853.1 Helix-turn-helix domain-containing protein [Brevibacterium casei CIP 102111]VEW15239.1 HTH-type transcriptional regulator sinR [Brevibacterium casei]
MRASPPPPRLWRQALGRVVRVRRTELGLTLAEVSRRSGVSTQYLSEIERGLKDPSSEVIEAIADVLGLALPQVLVLAAADTEQGSLQLANLGALASAPGPHLRGPARTADFRPTGQAMLALAA